MNLATCNYHVQKGLLTTVPTQKLYVVHPNCYNKNMWTVPLSFILENVEEKAEISCNSKKHQTDHKASRDLGPFNVFVFVKGQLNPSFNFTMIHVITKNPQSYIF